MDLEALENKGGNMLKVFTAFSGYDSQCMALDRLNLDYDLVGWSEIDYSAIQAHNAVYPQWKERNYGDICKIDWTSVPNFDLFTYSFPCTQISNAGKRTGLDEGSGTSSSLLWECRKAIKTKQPKYLLMENVSALLDEKFIESYYKWCSELEDMGYSNYTKVLNSKNYGIPQNRERVYMVSILGTGGPFYFPKPMTLEKTLKDFLETDVDEKYYIGKRTLDYFLRNSVEQSKNHNGFKFEILNPDGLVKTITTKSGSRMIDNFLGVDGNSFVIPVNDEPTVEYHGLQFKNYETINLNASKRWLHNGMAGISRTIKAVNDLGLVDNMKIRKFTERECFRLMGVSESDIDKILSANISSTQLYKMAGNSIVVDVLYNIFRKLFVDKKCEYGSITLF